jgi:hypothetical protein
MKRVFILTLVLLVAATAPAHATIEEAERRDLVDLVDEAVAQQNVCYGWDLTIDDASGVDSGRSEAMVIPQDDSTAISNVGVAGREPCSRSVVLVVNVIYTSESSESPDTANWQLDGILERSSTGLELDQQRLVDDPAYEIYQTLGKLPGLVAEAGLAPFVDLQVNEQPLAPDQALSGSPTPDWMRNNSTLLWALALGIAGSLAWMLYAGKSLKYEADRARRRKARRQRRRRPATTDNPVDKPETPTQRGEDDVQ